MCGQGLNLNLACEGPLAFLAGARGAALAAGGNGRLLLQLGGR